MTDACTIHGMANPHAGFVGRHRELDMFRAALETAFVGKGNLMMLAGEAGIGKTSIVQAFAMDARTRGTIVLWGCCFEGDCSPLWPVA